MRFTIGKKVQFGDTYTVGEVLRIFAEQKLVEVLKESRLSNVKPHYSIALWPMSQCREVDPSPAGVRIPDQLRARVEINVVIAGLDSGTITTQDAIERLKRVREFIKNAS